MFETIILVLIFLLASGAFLNSWICRMRIELLEDRITKRLEQRVIQLHSMQYNAMHRQGWTREELRDAFPTIEDN